MTENIIEEFNKEITFSNKFKSKDIRFIKSKNIPDNNDKMCVVLKANAPLYAWNYFENNLINEDEILFNYDLDIKEFKIRRIENNIIIALYGKNKIKSLQSLITILFNEKDYHYDSEFGFSNFSFNDTCFYIKGELEKCYKVNFKDYEILLSEN